MASVSVNNPHVIREHFLARTYVVVDERTWSTVICDRPTNQTSSPMRISSSIKTFRCHLTALTHRWVCLFFETFMSTMDFWKIVLGQRIPNLSTITQWHGPTWSVRSKPFNRRRLSTFLAHRFFPKLLYLELDWRLPFDNPERQIQTLIQRCFRKASSCS